MPSARERAVLALARTSKQAYLNNTSMQTDAARDKTSRSKPGTSFQTQPNGNILIWSIRFVGFGTFEYPLAVLRSPHQTKPKYTPPCYSLFLTISHSKRRYPFYSAKNAEILLYLINFLVFRNFSFDILVSIV